ncbi:HNH endonuclease [Pyxidicoccus fallax]|uniref:HNH endonuclease n=1 Tax=Pyxidicoccus fallax TaxID=394095 RepID=A0A848LG20_9BACT|nr:HNH endonuclease signature motif containing protein [Pyxidicoccus fallax]NMO14678.1 HNH endonuclease [Pyxidicoccus fallax]NPC78469.1 HNH endonuclease [Pyxidicoccus fallax]
MTLPALILLLASLAASPPTVEVVPATSLTIETVSAPEAPGLVGQETIAGKVRTGKSFTRQQKQVIKQKNAQENEGKTRCENCDIETVPAKKHEKGVTPPPNETQVDHKVPKSKGGAGEVENGQVLCRDCNLKKGNKEPSGEESP